MSTLDTVHSLGLLYFNQKKLKEAEETYQQVLAGREKTLGPDHIPTYRYLLLILFMALAFSTSIK